MVTQLYTAAPQESTRLLKSDGTVVAAGEHDYGECDVSDWTDIIAVWAGCGRTVGLRADGTVIVTGPNNDLLNTVSGMKLFDDMNNIEAEIKKKTEEKRIAEEKQRIAEEKQRIAEKKATYRSKGLCQHCGGTFKGLFTKKCSNCGKEKDY